MKPALFALPFVLAGAILGATHSPCRADTVSYDTTDGYDLSYSVTSTGSGLSSSGASATHTVYLPKFNPSLGTLTGVRIELLASVEGLATVEPGTWVSNITFTEIYDPNDTSIIATMWYQFDLTNSTNADTIEAVPLGDADINDDGSTPDGTTWSWTGAGYDNTLTTNLSRFIGTGNYGFTANYSCSNAGTGASGKSFSTEADGGVGVRITYTYTP